MKLQDRDSESVRLMPPEQALVTIVIPTFRRSGLLERAIKSVLHQSIRELEVHVYDNASGDETEAVVMNLARQDGRVRYHRHPENIGMIANMNYGLARATTPYVSLLPDDDVLLPRFLETTLAAFQQFPDLAFAAGSVIQMTEQGRVIHVPLASWPRMGYFAPPEGALAMTGRRHPSIMGIVFCREVLHQDGLLNPDITIADVELELRIAMRKPVWVTREPCALFVEHDTSTSYRADIAYSWSGFSGMLDSLKADTGAPAAAREQLVKVYSSELEGYVFGYGLRAIAHGHFDELQMAIDILDRQYGSRRRVTLLKWFGRVVHGMPFVRPVLERGHRIGKEWKLRRATKGLQQEYGAYARYLAHSVQ